MKLNLLLTFICLLCADFLFAQNLQQIKSQKPFTIDGSLSTTANFYSISGKESSRDPFSYVLSGSINVSVYSLQLPFSFVYSNSNFSYAQPFNRFGISPEYKWIRLHLGYRSMSFSPLTMAGHSFLGAGVELNPGLFRFGAVYGRFNQKTIPNTNNPLDTLQTPTRKGYSVKIGVGNSKNFADLIFLQIADDTLSFDKSQYGSKTPQANSVLGTHTKFTFFKKVTWETEGAVSLLTKNLYTNEPFNLNNNLLQNLVNNLKVNSTSEYSTAISSSLTYTERSYSVGLQYRRIDPNYQSFGAYYFNTDIENITVNMRAGFFKNKLSVNGNIGVQNDNLRNNKAAKSSRMISMANVNFNSGKVFSISGSFSNYSVNQQAGRLPLNDTIKLYQSNRSITLAPALTFSKAKNQQMLQLNMTWMDLSDHNPYTAASSEVNSRMALLNYFFNHPKSGLSLMAGLNYTAMSSSQTSQTIYGINTDIGKSFLKGKLTGHLGIASNRSNLNSTMGWVNTGTLSVNYRPHPKHSFKLNFSQIQNLYPENSSVKSFSETKVMFSYALKI
ncbi:MAG TPA: hypothetical protein PKH79_04665 [Prolixibacteraceae bacterium]|mgnify:CR=1 FL=1|nr:hypothetical protein [Prolixibacteraceae bacterium]